MFSAASVDTACCPLGTKALIWCGTCAVCHVLYAVCHVPCAICHVPRDVCHMPRAVCHMPRAMCLPLNSSIISTNVLLADEPLSWNSVEKMMEETPEMWKPELWRRNGKVFPLKDDYDMQRVLRMSPGRFESTKEIDEGRSQAEI